MLIDTRQGGLGDVWMRLSGLFTLAGIHGHGTYAVQVPDSMSAIAQLIFGDRLEVAGLSDRADYTYTSLGARSLLRQMSSGRRFITPYSSFVSAESNRPAAVDWLNQRIIRIFESTRLARSPERDDLHRYQGFSDVSPLARDLGIAYGDFLRQARQDFALLRTRLQAQWPHRASDGGSRVPQSVGSRVLVFPSGTSRQCMPSGWARDHFPDAHFAFFYKDALKAVFADQGLICREFREDPASMLELLATCDWCISTDSFASHLAQTYSGATTILLTEIAGIRVISPFFDGVIVPSLAPCYPCRKTVRSPGSTCQAGFNDCLNWTVPAYAQMARNSVESATA